jgi:hypothetical protein
VSGGDCENYIVLADGLETKRSVYAPTKNGICFAAGKKCGNRTKYAGDLKVPAIEFLAQANCPIGTRRIRLGRELRSFEDNI